MEDFSKMSIDAFESDIIYKHSIVPHMKLQPVNADRQKCSNEKVMAFEELEET